MNIPEYVLDDLAEVREGGAYNMLSRNEVLADTSINTQDWFDKHPKQYMDALREMGKRRQS